MAKCHTNILEIENFLIPRIHIKNKKKNVIKTEILTLL